MAKKPIGPNIPSENTAELSPAFVRRNSREMRLERSIALRRSKVRVFKLVEGTERRSQNENPELLRALINYLTASSARLD